MTFMTIGIGPGMYGRGTQWRVAGPSGSEIASGWVTVDPDSFTPDGWIRLARSLVATRIPNAYRADWTTAHVYGPPLPGGGIQCRVGVEP